MFLHLSRRFYGIVAAAVLGLSFAGAAGYFRFRALRVLALPGGLGAAEKRRLRHYFFGTTYLAVLFCTLRGRARSRKEKRLFVHLAALAFFFDDLAEAAGARDAQGNPGPDNPETYGKARDGRGWALHFLQNIQKSLPVSDLPEFEAFMRRVFNVETAGRQRETLSVEELQRITAEKGGCSVLMFRRLLAHPLSAAESEALYAFGLLIQLSDDIFDLWFDCRDGIDTLAVFFAAQNRLPELTQLFDKQVIAVHEAFRQMPYARFSVELSLAVLRYLAALTRVCLRHYQKLQEKRGTLPFDDRAALVVDMAHWRNRFRFVVELLA